MSHPKMTAKEVRERARLRAGIILESTLNAGWWPDDLEEELGETNVTLIATEIMRIAARLTGER